MTRAFALTVLALLGATPALADVAYVEASSELDGGKPATYAYNLVDGKDTTAWCSAAGSTKETLVFGFAQPTKVTHLVVVIGQKKGDALDPSRARAKTLWVSDGGLRRDIPVKDVPEPQEVKLDPPIHARRVIVDFPDRRGVDGKPDAPLCVAELGLKSGKSELTGEELAKKVRALPTPARRLLHAWVDDPAAPERTLIFNLDGTYTYTFEPLMEGKPVKLTGKWSTAGKTIAFETKGKKTSMRARVTKIDDGERQTTELMLEDEGPDPSMISTYRQAPARYE